MPPIENNPFTPKGRIMRTSFIINTIVIWIIAGLAWLIPEVRVWSWNPLIAVGSGALFLVLFIVAVFAGIKRLRDVKKSVWLAVILIFPIADVVFQIVLFFLPSEWKEPVPVQTNSAK